MFKKAIVLVITSLFVFSCSEKQNKATTETFVEKNKTKQQVGSLSDSNLPDWVLDPSIQGKVSAVGIASKTAAGIQLQIAQAEANGRANLATSIQTEVSRITKDATKQVKINGTEQVEQFFAQATQEVVKNLPISGARRVNIFQSPQDGTMYIQMVIDSSIVQQYLKDRVELFSESMKKAGVARETIKETEQSMKSLFNEIGNNNNKDVVEQIGDERVTYVKTIEQ